MKDSKEDIKSIAYGNMSVVLKTYPQLLVVFL